MPIYAVHLNGREQYTIPNVLAPVALAGVETTSGSNVIAHTALSGSAVYPGMSVRGPGIPLGAFIGAIKDSTHLELWCSAWNASTGVWTTTAANANATASASGLTAYAMGYDPACIVMQFHPQGNWRNEVGSTTMQIPVTGSATSPDTVVISGPGIVTANAEVTALSYGGTPAALTPTYGAKSDSYATTPLKRHEGPPYGVRILVSTGGHQSEVPASRQWQIAYAGADV